MTMIKPYEQDAEYDRLLAEERLILAATELVAEAMERRGVNRKELAEKLGVTPGEITQRLSGTRNLTLRSLAAMLHALEEEADVRLLNVSDALETAKHEYHGERLYAPHTHSNVISLWAATSLAELIPYAESDWHHGGDTLELAR